MNNSAERDARLATQTLLDIAIKASQRRNSGRDTGSRAPKSGTKETRPAQFPCIAASTLRPSGMGRIVTSGDSLRDARLSSDSTSLQQRDSQLKSNRQTGAQTPERVTVIVQKPPSKEDGKPLPAEASADVPVPASAFASLKSGVNSAKSEADMSPFSTAALPPKDPSGESAGTESDEQLDHQIEENESKRPAKRQKMTRSVSINTILQRVGSREGPLAEVAGTTPLTVQDMVEAPASSRPLDQGVKKGKASVLGSALATQIGQNVTAQSMPPALPPRKSSDQSTLDMHKHIALQDSSNTVETVMKGRAEAGNLPRALSAERELHVPSRPPLATPPGKTLESGMLSGITQQQPSTMASAQGADETHKLVMWRGKVKHCLKTAEGASTVELFSISAFVPEKLTEQMPPTLFVSALAGRSNVKLGKHFVAQCRFEDLEERQRQKVTALAIMKLVAICELQHCTLTLVPFTDSNQCLRIVGFLIADD